MTKRKSLTAAEQREKFRQAAERRRADGLPTLEDADAEIDARIARSIKDHGA